MFATIVVGTDGSQTARRAVSVAADLARQCGARLHVVHAFHDPSGADGGSLGAAPSRWHEAGKAVLDSVLADPTLSGLHPVGHTVDGAAADAIVSVATSVGAELIVVGNRGMYGTSGEGGSVPQSVVRRAPCHVLVAQTS
ncbi:MAG: universal stress protein [Actinomycetota bacterium]|jgi:nucleotide-binding universal stress UspA family protein|nr:universal stress protein [Actinomycetota bacterium]